MGIGYINGKYVALEEPVIPIDERGHQFGDGIYEVIRVYHGTAFMLNEHLERLFNSAKAIKLRIEGTADDFCRLVEEAILKSGLSECSIYLQITRGIAPRKHLFPAVPVSLSMTVNTVTPPDAAAYKRGISAQFHEDERWTNCYIKSLNLLPNILAKQEAHEAGCFEAILVKDGRVTEGSSSNIFLVKDGKVWTAPLSRQILSGITRMAVKQICEELQIEWIEKSFTPEELLQGEEAFLTSTVSEILPIVSVGGRMIGNGRPGEITSRLYQRYQEIVQSL
nr:D-amino-acid transaminase [uncultured Bacillus sp.]